MNPNYDSRLKTVVAFETSDDWLDRYTTCKDCYLFYKQTSRSPKKNGTLECPIFSLPTVHYKIVKVWKVQMVRHEFVVPWNAQRLIRNWLKKLAYPSHNQNITVATLIH